MLSSPFVLYLRYSLLRVKNFPPLWFYVASNACASLCTLDFPLHTPTYPPHTPVILDNFTPTENAVLFFLAYLASTIEDLLAADVYVFYGHLLFNR
jgi:hypothetical protein